MDPKTKPGAGEPPHAAWRNRDYAAAEEARRSGKYRWMQIVAAVLSIIILLGLAWGSLQPLMK